MAAERIPSGAYMLGYPVPLADGTKAYAIASSSADPSLNQGAGTTTSPTVVQSASGGSFPVQVTGNYGGPWNGNLGATVNVIASSADNTPRALLVATAGYSAANNGFVALPTDNTAAYVAPTPTASAMNAIVPVTTLNATSLQVKGAAGNFYGGSIVAGATAGFLIAYNSASVPAAGALTANSILAVVPVAANASAAIGDFQIPDRFSTGVVLLFSTAVNSYSVPANSAQFMRGRAA